MKGFLTIVLLLSSNVFMTFAWYAHLRFEQWKWFHKLGLFGIILFSWGLAFFEYVLQVPANRIGFNEKGGPFSLMQLKVLQEVISIGIFIVFSFMFFKNQQIAWNHYLAMVFLVLAVFFVFYK